MDDVTVGKVMRTFESALAFDGSAESERARIVAMSICMAAAGIAAFLPLMLGIAAPYGRYVGSANWLYGPLINGKLAWVLQELPSFLVVLTCWVIGVREGGNSEELTTLNPRTALLLLFLFHYFNRSIIYPLRLRGGKPTPFNIMMMAFVFCLWNGYQQGRWLVTYSPAPAPSLLEPRFLLGVALFLCGLAINWQSDDILRCLRKPGDTGYHIPRGGMFEYVSGANFFGEIVEWTGFAIATNSLPAAAFAFFTFCNIGPRAAQHHAWYRRQFKDYPKCRKAVIPFVW